MRIISKGQIKTSALLVVLLMLTQILFMVALKAAPQTIQNNPSLNLQRAALATPIKASGKSFVDNNGKRFFMIGVNYTGSTDRAWKMWEDGQFDANLINRDFGLVAGAGLNVVRLFVMTPLKNDINANRWDKLDKVVELARNNGLTLLLTFNDYAEPNLAREADLNRKVAARYANERAIFGYDLKNEPQFGDVATADFPAGLDVPFLKDDFIKAMGEKKSQDEVNQWRNTNEGKQVVPVRFDARRAYLYANAYLLYVDFINEAGQWVNSNSGKNTLDYIDSPASAKWRPFLEAVNGTVAKWIEVRLAGVRGGDNDALVTIGWSNAILAKMSANRDLSFVALHRFVTPGYSSLIATMRLLENLQTTFGEKPVTLEEFGYANARDNGDTVSPDITANHEMALWLYLYGRGYAGGAKWMLVNFPSGANAVQNSYGLLDDTTQPKIAYRAVQAFTAYVESENHQPGGKFANLQPNGSDITYTYEGAYALFTNMRDSNVNYRTNIGFVQDRAAPFAAWWQPNGEFTFWATVNTQAKINLTYFYPHRVAGQPITLTVDGQSSILAIGAFDFPSTEGVGFSMKPNTFYKVKVPVGNNAFLRAQQLGGSNLYFQETGHNLGGAFRQYWEKNGGLAINGFPLSEEFQEGDYRVQYFERSRFEYHPENVGTPYTVLLGHFGRIVTDGRGGEAPFQAIAPFTSTNDKWFFRETSHAMGGAFKKYWQENGGLFQFGFPITEEFQEKNPSDGKIYTVQYFERARFEYHPENRGTRYEVLLGLLGWQIARTKGYIP